MKLKVNESDSTTYTGIYRRFIGYDDKKALQYAVEDAKKQLDWLMQGCKKGLGYLDLIDTDEPVENDPDDPFPSTPSQIIDALDLIIDAQENIRKAVDILRIWG